MHKTKAANHLRKFIAEISPVPRCKMSLRAPSCLGGSRFSTAEAWKGQIGKCHGVPSSCPSPAVVRKVRLPSSFNFCRQAQRTGYRCPFTSISPLSRRPFHFVPLGRSEEH